MKLHHLVCGPLRFTRAPRGLPAAALPCRSGPARIGPCSRSHALVDQGAGRARNAWTVCARPRAKVRPWPAALYQFRPRPVHAQFLPQALPHLHGDGQGTPSYLLVDRTPYMLQSMSSEVLGSWDSPCELALRLFDDGSKFLTHFVRTPNASSYAMRVCRLRKGQSVITRVGQGSSSSTTGIHSLRTIVLRGLYGLCLEQALRSVGLMSSLLDEHQFTVPVVLVSIVSAAAFVSWVLLHLRAALSLRSLVRRKVGRLRSRVRTVRHTAARFDVDHAKRVSCSGQPANT